MMNYRYLHEVEAVVFRPDSPRPTAALVPVFREEGFTLHEDVFSLDRSDSVYPWQHSSVVEVELLHGGKEVFDLEGGMWDTMIMKYLFAYLPFQHADRFVTVVFSVARKLGLPIRFEDRDISRESLLQELHKFKDELFSAVGEEPGSEGLAILIQSTYPRR